MAEDVGECGFEVAVDLDFGDLDVRAVSALDELASCLAAVLDDFSGVASQEDLAYRLLVWRRVLRLREVPRGIERFGEGEVLFGNNTS
jgi:hypothetical protein